MPVRDIDPDVQAALEARALVFRDFISFYVRDRDTDEIVPEHLWSGTYNVTAAVIDPDTGSSENRAFQAVGSELVSISDIPMVSTLTVQDVTIILNQIAERVDQLVRQYDCKQAKVEIFRGLYSPATRIMVAPAENRFSGFVDLVDIQEGAEGEAGATTVTAKSHTQEMTRSNPDTRSDHSQKLRNPTDDFYADTAAVGEWEISWGKKSGKAA